MRLRMLPLPLLPVAIAAAAAIGEAAAWDRLVWVLLTVLALHLAGILITDLFDHRAGTDKLAKLDRSAIATGSLQLEAGTLTPAQVLRTALASIAVAVVGTAILADTSLWILLGVGLVLVTQQAGPPLRISYVGGGLGELVLLAAYGPLPAVATSIALTGTVQGAVVAASIILGALTAMGLASHHLLHWRSDRAATKRTPIVILGEEGGLAAIGVVDIFAYLALIASVVTGVLPVWSVAGVVGAPVVGAAWRAALADPLPQRTMQLVGAHLGAAVIAAMAIAAGFLAD